MDTNHDILFLLYTGARLMSILNSYDEKHRNGTKRRRDPFVFLSRCSSLLGIYPAREWFGEALANILTNKVREFSSLSPLLLPLGRTRFSRMGQLVRISLPSSPLEQFQ